MGTAGLSGGADRRGSGAPPPPRPLTEEQRRAAAVVGAVTADAACVPLHWCYKRERLAALLSRGADPAFFSPPANPYYRVPIGSPSCYADQLLLLGRHIARRGSVDPAELHAETVAYFGEGGPGGYWKPQLQMSYPNGWYKQKPPPPGAPEMPLPGGWLHGSIKDVLRGAAAGGTPGQCGIVEGNQPAVDCLAKVAPTVARFAGDPELYRSLDAAVRVTQRSDMAAAVAKAAAMVLEGIVLGRAPDAAVSETVRCLSGGRAPLPSPCDAEIAAALRAVRPDRPHREHCEEVGRA
eukprot:TRINITY_DN29487_c0_g1_i1.p4 TRINITY_DN29487_c0_g1~~TRINITY_DN29487_c0_g1_i1.p4  ORF type:complete len:328 (+),score=81.40 TRINITY_DN29487_c0_g1_i1:104-985(+)